MGINEKFWLDLRKNQESNNIKAQMIHSTLLLIIFTSVEETRNQSFNRPRAVIQQNI